MMKFILFGITLCFAISCTQKESQSNHLEFDKSDCNYQLLCLDDTEKDTLLMLSIDFKTDSAELRMSDKTDLGAELNLNWQDDSKFYELYIHKLKKNVGGNYQTKLESLKHFFPSDMKRNTVESFANATLHVMQNPDSTFFTPINDGFGDDLESALFELSWFPEFQDNDYTIIEHYQDSKVSWTNVLSK